MQSIAAAHQERGRNPVRKDLQGEVRGRRQRFGLVDLTQYVDVNPKPGNPGCVVVPHALVDATSHGGQRAPDVEVRVLSGFGRRGGLLYLPAPIRAFYVLALGPDQKVMVVGLILPDRLEKLLCGFVEHGGNSVIMPYFGRVCDGIF